MLLDTLPPPPDAPDVDINRMLSAGTKTVLASLGAVHIVRLAAIHIPGANADSLPLGWIAPTFDTLILVTFGVLVFGAVIAASDFPIRKYRWIAFGALLVSFLPLTIVARGGRSLGGNVPTAFALALMHIAAYVPCVTLLPRLMLRKRSPAS